MRAGETARALKQILGIQTLKADEARFDLAAAYATVGSLHARRNEAEAAVHAASEQWSVSVAGRIDPVRFTVHAQWVAQCETRFDTAKKALDDAEQAAEAARARSAACILDHRQVENAFKDQRRTVIRQCEEQAQHRIDERTAYAWFNR